VSAPAQLRAFIEKFETKDQRLIRAVRKAVRKRLPTAHELVYDNYNFFVIGYSPTERPGDAVISIAARANAVSLCFLQGARLPDPGKLCAARAIRHGFSPSSRRPTCRARGSRRSSREQLHAPKHLSPYPAGES
jgi:hypothetical protein